MCMDRLVPPRRERRLSIALPPINTPADAAAAGAAIIAATAAGELTLSEAADRSRMVVGRRRGFDEPILSVERRAA